MLSVAVGTPPTSNRLLKYVVESICLRISVTESVSSALNNIIKYYSSY